MPRWNPPLESGHPFPPPAPHRPPHGRPPHEVLGEGLAHISTQIDELNSAVVEMKVLLQARSA